eukprot:1177417-Rhodomonas_salina.1
MCSVDDAIASLQPAKINDFLHLLNDSEFREDFTISALPDADSVPESEWRNETSDPLAHGASHRQNVLERITNTTDGDDTGSDAQAEDSSPSPDRGSSPSNKAGRRAIPWSKQEHSTFLMGLQ